MTRSIRLVASALAMIAAAPANAADAADEAHARATVKRWVEDFNAGDLKRFVARCAPHAAVLDGFPPYTWTSCRDWMATYATNSESIKLTDGRLAIGDPVASFFDGDRGYLVYPARFSDKEGGKPVVYTGTWTMTLRKTAKGWFVTGSGSNWGGDYTVRSKP